MSDLSFIRLTSRPATQPAGTGKGGGSCPPSAAVTLLHVDFRRVDGFWQVRCLRDWTYVFSNFPPKELWCGGCGDDITVRFA